MLNNLQKNFIDALKFGAVSDELLEMLMPANSLSVEEAISIYQHGYKARLIECLKSDYPGLRKFLGDEIFSKFAFEYLDVYPSFSTSLFSLGEKFPQYLAESSPLYSVASKFDSLYLELPVILAEFERLKLESSRAKGVEYSMLETMDDKTYCDLDEIKQCVCQAPATLNLMEVGFDLPTIYSAIDNPNQEVASLLEEKNIYLAIARINYEVKVYVIDFWEYAFLFELKEIRNKYRKKIMTVDDVVLSIIKKYEMNIHDIYARLSLWLPIAKSKGFWC